MVKFGRWDTGGLQGSSACDGEVEALRVVLGTVDLPGAV